MVKPVRNPGYLRWIRSLPCAVCRTTYAVEAAHTGPHGLVSEVIRFVGHSSVRKAPPDRG